MAVSVRLIIAALIVVSVLAIYVTLTTDESAPGPATSPGLSDFEPQAGEPRLVEPAALPAPGAGAGQRQLASPEMQSGTTRPQESSASSDAVGSSNESRPDQTSSYTGGVQPHPASGPGPQPGGPMASGETWDPANEMISLPPTGPGPEAGSSGMMMEGPEHGALDASAAPEAGSSGMQGPAPELLPVRYPGPSGEMPEDNPQ